MKVGRRTVAMIAALAGFVAFCVVQDRVTAAGARHYVALSRAADSTKASRPTVVAIMRPAISRSVRLGLMAAVGTALAVAVVVTAAARFSRS